MRPFLKSLVLPILLAGCSSSDVAQGKFVNTDISITIPSDVSSSMLRVFIYDHSGGGLTGQFFMPGTQGDSVFTCSQSFREGIYDLVAYNFDMSDTFIRGESSILTLEAYTEKVSESISNIYAGTGGISSDVVYTPEMMAVARLVGVSIKEGAVISGRADVVTKNTVINIAADGLSYARSCSAVVNGFSSSLFIGTGSAGSDDCLYVGLRPYVLEGNSGYLSASFHTFGSVSKSHDFQINVTSGSESVMYTATTGDTFVFPGGIEIPESGEGGGGSGSGFTPKVGQWKDLQINIPIGI